MATSIELRNLSIGYRNGRKSYCVVQGINAAIERGKLTCLIGSNGAGKSTLLRTLSAFQPKLAGEILIEGKEIDSFSPEELSHKIGVVLTERPSVENLTVFQVAAMGRSPYTGFFGRLSGEDRRIVADSLAMVGISHLADRMAGTLSDGERQKMMTAKALAQQTAVVYLDEPTSFLDYGSKVDTLLMLRRLCHEEGKTIFLSTHDLELALQIADVLWVMMPQGITVGSPAELAARGTLSQFIDRPGLKFDAASMSIRIVKA